MAGKLLKIHEPTLLSSDLFLGILRSLEKEKAALLAVFRESIRDGSWERDVAEVIRLQTERR